MKLRFLICLAMSLAFIACNSDEPDTIVETEPENVFHRLPEFITYEEACSKGVPIVSYDDELFNASIYYDTEVDVYLKVGEKYTIDLLSPSSVVGFQQKDDVKYIIPPYMVLGETRWMFYPTDLDYGYLHLRQDSPMKVSIEKTSEEFDNLISVKIGRRIATYPTLFISEITVTIH